MKCYIVFRNLFFLILLSPFYTSAQTSNLTIQGYSDLPERFIYLYRNIGPLGLNTHLDTIPLNQKGEFIFHLHLLQPEDVSLNFGKQNLRLWLKPNTSVTLRLSDSGYLIKGPMSTYAYYYLDYLKETPRLYEEYEKKYPGYNKKGSEYTDAHFIIVDSITQGKFKFLDSYFINKNLPGKKQFVENEKASILYSDLFYKVVSDDTAYKKFTFFQQKLHVSGTSTYTFSNQLTMDDSKLLPLPTYQRFVSNAIPHIGRQIIVEQGKAFSFNLWMDNQMAVIDQLSTDPYCNLNNKAIVINEFVNQIRYSRRIQWANKLYSIIAQLQPKDKGQVLQDIKGKLDGLVKETKFLKGAVAPAFTFTDTAGKIYHLEDFKGKIVYIDVWATWCGPCIALEPAWNKLVTNYTAKDSIIFLSVSLDDTRDKWMKFLKLHHPAGIVLHAGDGGWKSSFAINYDIQGIPHFILLDKNGKILAYSAPQPDKTDELERILKPD
jgi:thiol-disulfide isomerase/thioredoxin